MSKRKTTLSITKDNDGYLINFKRSDTDMNRQSADVIDELIREVKTSIVYKRREVSNNE